ncbi:alpha/beta fold hydrolase [Solimonas marina]|uniref:Alpha/beta hydrolase n=1 Tax=Solimonas marina TaxID=2714601 RepID=A0A969W7T4_9GAMM|nr:alpha/beta hydrolase [Solimonas marina]NKF22286.1 alpha/beta hydrolase [Solimonas marina]
MNPNPPWILLRGLVRDARHWGAFPAQLAEALGGATVVAIDLPGNGARCAQRSPTRIAEMAADVRGELQRLAPAPRYRVLAMSLGGMVAAAWADAYPQELDAVALINTSLKPFSPFWQRLRPAAYPAVLRTLIDGDVRRGEETILRLTSAAPDAHRSVVDDWVAWREAQPVSRANALRQLRAAMAYRAPETAPAVPMLALVGLLDGLVDPICSQRLAARWRLPLAMHPDAGHDLPLDDPAWVIDKLKAWRP